MSSTVRPPLNRALLLLSGAALGFLPVAPAYADELVSADDNQAENFIVVTARRRSENVQDVPVALSVVSGDQIEARGDYSLASIQQIVPNLQLFSFNPRNTNINIRGLGSNISLTNDGLENGVGVYIDDVYYGRVGSSQFDLVDLERVEVLRGPQGTLFGKNTTAGAISITTRAPSFEFGGSADLSVGDYDYRQIRGTVTGPLTDWAAVRLSVADTTRGGLGRNVLTNRSIHDYNNFTARGQLLLKPSDTLTVRLIGDYGKQTLNCCIRFISDIFTKYDDGATVNNNFLQRAARVGYTPLPVDPFARRTDANSPFQANMHQWGVSGKVDWDLGPVTLTSITAYRKWFWYPRNDSDFTSASVQLQSHQENQQRQFSQEVRLASNGNDRLSYVVGAYYYWQIIEGSGASSYGHDAPLWNFPNANPVVREAAINGFTTNSSSDPQTKSLALFGQATYDFVPDRLGLTVGLRYSHEKKDGSYSQWWVGGNDLSGLTPDQRAAAIALRNTLNPVADWSTGFTDDSFSGIVTLSYKPTTDLLIFGTYSRGNKSGGLNLTNIPPDVSPDVGPETVDHFEIGLKSQLWDRRITFNAAAFWTDVADYQTAIVDQRPSTNNTRNYITNIPLARSRGVEFDANIRANDYINLNGSVSYTDAYYVDFKNAPPPVERNPATATTPYNDLSGQPLSGSPKWQWNIGGDFEAPISDSLWGEVSAYARADYSWRSEYYTAVSNSRYSLVPSYGIANARLGLRFGEGTLDVSIWAKNLLDNKYIDTLTPNNTGLVVATLGDPRTFGATIRTRF